MLSRPVSVLPSLFGEGCTKLYSSKCVDVCIDERTSKVTIVAHGGNNADASCAITGIMQATEALLRKDAKYVVVWDLRNSPTPGMRETMRLAAWGLSKQAKLERLTTKMGVIVQEGPVASVAGGLLGAFSRVPTIVSPDADGVHEYVMVPL
tara:strand:+ start:310 stop:762 length:453 start_codon:yes stop_codon:yes gene_type:complete